MDAARRNAIRLVHDLVKHPWPIARRIVERFSQQEVDAVSYAARMSRPLGAALIREVITHSRERLAARRKATQITLFGEPSCT